MANEDRRFGPQDTVHAHDAKSPTDRQFGLEPASRPAPRPDGHGR